MTTSTHLIPLTLPTQEAATWLEQRTAAALEQAKNCVAALKSGHFSSTTELLELWNEVERVLSGAAALGSTLTELHPDSRTRTQGEKTLQAIDNFHTAITLDAELYSVFANAEGTGLDADSQRLLDHTVRDFRRSGVNKPDQVRARIAEISQRMTVVGQQFSRNIRDDVRSIKVTAEQVKGLPQDWIDQHPPHEGYITVTTDYPDALPFFTHAQDRTARLELRKAFLNRGWPQNDEVLQELFALRREYASLVGYDTWADYDAEVKMVGSGQAIKDFIDSVAQAADESAQRDYAVLLQRVQQDYPQATEVSLADKDYYVELVRKEQFGVDSAHVRQFFRLERVLDGVLDLTRELFGVEFHPTQVPVWHDDVRAFNVTLDGEPLGRAYLDLHPRDGKFGHAAQFTLVDGVSGIQQPEGVLGCNFGRDLLDHDDVVTLFHEFGHLLHHLLAGDSPYIRFSGVATEWDFVEAPSQMFEEWAWDPHVLARFAINDEGEAIPADLVQRMRKAKDFGKGFDALTQMFYAAMSYTFHVEKVEDLTEKLKELQAKYSLFGYIPNTHMMASFGHLDGYSSGYYTYMWSLVIAKDLLSAFGGDLFNTEIAHRYRDEVLVPGGRQDATQLVQNFLGRPYTLDAFHSWLAT